MNNYLKISATVILAATTLSACSDKEDELKIPLSEVPANIINTVQNALPGIKLTEAEKETEDDIIIYELEGTLINGKKYEIEIAEDGTIIEIELED